MKYWEQSGRPSQEVRRNETKRMTHYVRDEQGNEIAERVAEVFGNNLNIKCNFDVELLEHTKDEKERVTENPDAQNTPTIFLFVGHKRCAGEADGVLRGGRLVERSEDDGLDATVVGVVPR